MNLFMNLFYIIVREKRAKTRSYKRRTTLSRRRSRGTPNKRRTASFFTRAKGTNLKHRRLSRPKSAILKILKNVKRAHYNGKAKSIPQLVEESRKPKKVVKKMETVTVKSVPGISLFYSYLFFPVFDQK